MTLLDIFDQCALIGRLNRELRRTQADYKSMRLSYSVALTRLDLANQREEALAAALEEARGPCSCCEALTGERDDALREVDDVRAALHWLEKDFKVGGAA